MNNTSKDITQAMANADAQYRVLVENCPTAFVISRFDQIIFVNQACLNMFGYKSVDDIKGSTLFDHVAPESRAEFIDRVTRRFRGEEVSNRYEAKALKTDGSTFPFEAEIACLELAGGMATVAFVTDISAHKEAESKIRKSEKELQEILDSLQDTYYRINLEGRLIKISSSIEQLLGFCVEDIIHEKFDELYLETSAGEKFFLELSRQSGSVTSYQTQMCCKDGAVIWVSMNAHYLYDEHGDVISIEGTARDITERINGQEALRRSEERFRAIFERSGSGIVLIDLKDHPLVTNKAVRLMLGYSESEFSKMNFTSFIHPEDAKKIIACQRQVEAGECDFSKFEVRCFCKTGQLIWVSLNISAILDERGDVDSLVAVIDEITDRKNIEAALEQGTAKFKAIFNAISDAVVFVDTAHRIIMINPAVTKIFGYSLEEIENQSAELFYTNAEDFTRQGMSSFDENSSSNQQLFDVSYTRKDGTVFIGETFCTKIENDHDQVIGFVGIIRDVSQRKRIEDRLRLSQKIFEDTGKAILVTDAHAVVVDVNQAFCDITGYSREELAGKRPLELQSERYNIVFYKKLLYELKNTGCWQGELWNRKKSGEEYPVWATISSVKNEQDSASHYVAVFSDISAIKETEERLEYLAHYDQLTGLPNRMLFHDRLFSAVARAKRRNQSIAVMYVDLDGFKQVNDTLGHSEGDDLLKRIGTHLASCVREEDTIARLGGDEFAIIINELESMSYLHTLAKRIVGELAVTLSYEGRELRVSGSVGIAIYPLDGVDEEGLLRSADQAMYHAKQKGKDTYQLFDSDMNARMMNRIHLESDLRHAIKYNELFVEYQPKYDLQKKRVVGLEALIRWNHPERGVLLPDDFIALAEDSELIVAVGNNVLTEVCQNIKKCLIAGKKLLPVAINISTRQFKSSSFVQDIKNAVEVAGIAAELLEIEITESLLMEDVGNTIIKLSELKMMGLKISIDDFGTGYSSLNYLKKLPVDALKIDRSFVIDIVDDADDRAIISAIISMAKNLNLRVIAEGVENRAQLAFLERNACHEAQGYLFSKPVSFADIEKTTVSIEENQMQYELETES